MLTPLAFTACFARALNRATLLRPAPAPAVQVGPTCSRACYVGASISSTRLISWD